MARSKREIDKDAMYRKIMPSYAKNLSTESNSTDKPADVEEPKPENESSAGKPSKLENQNVLVNLMEELVFSKLDAALARFNCCKCDKCKKEIAAIALNKLQAKYVVMDDNNKAMFSITEQQHSTEVTTALVQAILAVKANPKH